MRKRSATSADPHGSQLRIISDYFPCFLFVFEVFLTLFHLDEAYIPFKHKINTQKNKTNTVCLYGEIPFEREFIFIQNLFFNSPPPVLLPPQLAVIFVALQSNL